MTSGVEIIVSIDDANLHRLDEIATELERLGMTEQRRMHSIGVISGAVDPAVIAEIERIDGVGEVERSRAIQLPPPDSPIQ